MRLRNKKKKRIEKIKSEQNNKTNFYAHRIFYCITFRRRRLRRYDASKKERIFYSRRCCQLSILFNVNFRARLRRSQSQLNMFSFTLYALSLTERVRV